MDIQIISPISTEKDIINKERDKHTQITVHINDKLKTEEFEPCHKMVGNIRFSGGCSLHNKMIQSVFNIELKHIINMQKLRKRQK